MWAMCGEARPAGQVRPLRGRGRHRRHVLHLQVAEGEPPAEGRRHDRARHADLHALHRDDAPRGLRAEGGEHRAAPQENRFQFTDEEIKKLEDPKIKAFFVVNPGNPHGRGAQQGDDRQDRNAREDEAPRPDAPDRRRVRHLRRRTSARCWASCRRTRSASTPTRSTSAARAGGSASSRSTRTTSTTR